MNTIISNIRLKMFRHFSASVLSSFINWQSINRLHFSLQKRVFMFNIALSFNFRHPIFTPQQFVKWLHRKLISLSNSSTLYIQSSLHALPFRRFFAVEDMEIYNFAAHLAHQLELVRLNQESTSTFWFAMRSCSNVNSSRNIWKTLKKIIWIIWFVVNC